MPLRFTIILSSLVFILAACGSSATPPPPLPTRIPPTPISTHLPPVATGIPAGFDSNNPIQLVIVAADSEAASDLTNDLETQINALTSITLNVMVVESETEAARLLCDSETGAVSAAWLNGLSYIAASQCGIVTLQSNLGTVRSPKTGEAGVLMINSNFAEDGLPAALQETFCRISNTDFYSWTLPVMFLAIEEVDPATLTNIEEYPDYDAMVAAFKADECAVMGISESAWEAYLDADTDLSESSIIVSTSAEFPQQIMVFPFAADLEVINEITNILLRLDVASGRSTLELPTAEAEATAEATQEAEISLDADVMTAFFGEGFLMPVNAGDFAALDSFLESTGLNFVQIGQ